MEKQPRVVTNAQMKKLFKICQEFVVEREISCSETIYQCDHVVLNALEFIEKVCEVVGYHVHAEDE